MGRPPDDSQEFRLRTFYRWNTSAAKQADTLNVSKSHYVAESIRSRRLAAWHFSWQTGFLTCQMTFPLDISLFIC